MANINWYPGHMTKAKRMMAECLPLIDVAIELVDARIPFSSKNPDIAKMTENKPKFIVLNKSDLSDPVQNEKWLKYYANTGYTAVLFDSKTKNRTAAVNGIMKKISDVFSKQAQRNSEKGMRGRSLKIMVTGIPNVGKSTFINCLGGSKRVRAEDRPGVTRGRQWISLGGGIDLLDMPGILWPKLENQNSAKRLAMTGAIKDNVVDTEALACDLLAILRAHYEKNFRERYKLTEELPEDDYDLLGLISKKRGLILSGGRPDEERGAIMLLDEFRAGKLGRITLDDIEQLAPILKNIE